jgi:acetoin utilization protein AcuB
MIHHPPTLASAMTPFPYSIALDAPLDEADRLMKEHGIHHLPVTENHDVVGIITQRDMAAAFARRKARGRSTNKMSVSDLYVPEVYLVDLNEPIQNVLRVMAERHIGSAVVTRQGRLAGVFTSVDACRCFADFIEDVFPDPGGDRAA